MTIFGTQHDLILWCQLYLEDIDRSGGNIDQAVRQMTTTATTSDLANMMASQWAGRDHTGT